MNDIILTHYYLPDRKPFLNLSALEEDELKKVLIDLREKTRTGDSKRVFMDWYVEDRRKSEARIREAFIAKGGNPEKKYPHYFVVGTSSIQKSLSKNTLEVTIRLNDIPSRFICFTYPDSMASFDLENDAEHQMPYHGKIFTRDEIAEVIREYGMPADEIGYTSRYGYPKYIEAQLWSDKPIQKYL
jgi:hypothetical protein